MVFKKDLIKLKYKIHAIRKHIKKLNYVKTTNRKVWRMKTVPPKIISYENCTPLPPLGDKSF